VPHRFEEEMGIAIAYPGPLNFSGINVHELHGVTKPFGDPLVLLVVLLDFQLILSNTPSQPGLGLPPIINYPLRPDLATYVFPAVFFRVVTFEPSQEASAV
jgi:hypothetical protein